MAALLFLLGPSSALSHALDSDRPASTSAKASTAAVAPRPGAMFIENVGQFPEAARYYWPQPSGNQLWVADDGLWLTLQSPTNQSSDRLNLKVSFVGANPNPRLEPFSPLQTEVTYLKGAANEAWQSAVPVWGGIRYLDLYPGLDLELTSSDGYLTWQLVAQPQADIATLSEQVRLQIDGGQRISLQEQDFQVETAIGRFTLPLLQLTTADGNPVEATLPQPTRYGNQIIAPFAPVPPKPNGPVRNLVLQSSANLIYSTLLGGTESDCVLDCVIAVDGGGQAYIAGFTQSADFPTTLGVVQPDYNSNSDIFVAKLSSSGESIDYATFIGGDNSDYATGIAVDSQGSVYLTGYTASRNFPTTANTINASYGGGYSDAFAIKLKPDGTGLSYATLLGGASNDRGAGIAVDRRGNAYITGETGSTDFPTAINIFQPGPGGSGDLFVVKLNASGSSLLGTTLLGGSRADDGRAIALDELNNIYIAGRTTSPDFPVTENSLATEQAGLGDAFVVKLASNAVDLVYATFLGGSSNDQANAIAVAANGQVTVVGSTLSADFPTTAQAFDIEHDAGYDVFAAKLDSAGAGLIYSTLLGGSGGDRGTGVTLDGDGGAYVTGYTYSSDFPTSSRAFDAVQDGDFSDAFMVKLRPDGGALDYATFFGGDQTEYGTAIAVDGEGSAYLVGATQSESFPTSPNAFDSTFNGVWDAFVAKLALGNETTTHIISGVVRDQSGFAVSGAVVSAGAYGSTTSDSNGVFTLIGLEDGIYTLTTLKDGYTFTPARRTVTVPSSEGIQVFTGVAERQKPSPFLDLPFDYGNSAPIFTRALRDTHASGWVTSWFDHAYPTYEKNRNLMMWDGNARTKTGFNLSLGCYDQRCYDGHNGIDLAYRDPGSGAPIRNGVEILAAADGVVVATRANCVVGNTSCGGGYGNQVIIYHNNGYFTQYGHLASVSAVRGDIQSGEVLGIMGSTGHSTGPHLHFGVYQDDGNGTWDGDDVEKVVDPFGWRGAEADPWVVDQGGPISHYLWKRPLAEATNFVGSQGVNIVDTTDNLAITVPPNTFSGQVSLELFQGSVPSSRSGMRSTGHAFWLRLLEWLPTSRNALDNTVTTVASAESAAVQQPVSVTITYTDSEVLHLDVNRLTIARWDEPLQSWQPLSTTVNSAARQVSAQTDQLGQFELQAPLRCPADFVEPDDGYYVARSIEADGEAASRLFDIAQDEDWFYLEVDRGYRYTIQTLNLAAGADTLLELYSLDSETLLTSNDNGGGNLASFLQWRPPSDGLFFIRVAQGGSGSAGCGASYELKVTSEPAIKTYLPLVTK